MTSLRTKLTGIPGVAYATFFFITGVAGSRPLAPLHALEISIGPEEIGILVAVFALIPLALASSVGSWMDRHGLGRALFWSTAVGGVGIVLPFLFPGRAGLYASQAIAGTGFTVFILAAQNVSGRNADTAWARERSVAVFSMGIALASLVGPLVGGVVGDHFGYDRGFLLLGLTSFVATAFVYPLIARDRVAESVETATATVEPRRSRNPLRILGYHRYMGRAFLISALILMAKDIYVAYFPLYAISAGLSASVIGLIIALHNGGGVVMRFFMLPLIRVFGKDRVITLSILFSAACLVALPLTQAAVPLALISLALGLGLGLGQPLSITRTINLSPQEKVGEVLGVRLAFNRLTQVVTPLAVGGIVLTTGVSGVFVILGLVVAAGCTRLSVPAEEELGTQERGNA